MLSTLGLDAMAEAVYRAMLADPGGGVAALAVRIGTTEQRVRDGLDVLSKLALVRPSAENGGCARSRRTSGWKS